MSLYSDKVNSLLPVAYWRLGDAIGSTIAVDETGTYNGTYNGNPTLESTGLLVNDPDMAVILNGTTDNVTTINPIDFNYNETFSLSVIIEVDVIKTTGIMGNGGRDATVWGGYKLEVDSDNKLRLWFALDISLYGWIDVRSTTALLPNTKYHITVTYDGSGNASGVNIFINGLSDTVIIIADTLGNEQILSNQNFSIGYREVLGEDDLFFDGLIDEVSIFNITLTQQNVTDLYQASITGRLAFDITIDHTKVDEDLYNFPLLVNLGLTSGTNDYDSTPVFDKLHKPTPHQYWRLNCTANNVDDWTNIAEIEYIDINGTDLTLPIANGSLVTESSVNAPYDGFNAFDNDVATFWHSSTETLPQWIIYNTNALAKINPVGIKILPRAGWPARVPSDFTVSYSDDGVIWTEVLNVVGYTGYVDGVYSEFDFNVVDSNVDTTNLLTPTYINPADNAVQSKVYRDEVIALAPLAYYRLGETTGASIAVDTVGTYDATINAGITLESTSLLNNDLVNKSMLFNPSEQGILIPVGLNSDGFAQLTISCLVSFNDLVSEQIIFKDGGTSNGIGFGIVASQLTIGMSDNSVQITSGYPTSNLQINTVYHLVAMIDDTNNKLMIYIDGVNVVDTSVAFDAHDGTADTRIGSTYYASGPGWSNPLTGNTTENMPFNGSIDEFAIFNYILTPLQVLNLYGSDRLLPYDENILTKKCYAEINRWDQVNEQAQIWIKVPYISRDFDTLINFSYDPLNIDNSDYIGYTGSIPAQTVWDGYDAVYHLSKDGTDSTVNGYDGTLVNMDATNIVDADIGKALTFNDLDTYINLDVINSLLNTNDDVTIYGTFKTTSTPVSDHNNVVIAFNGVNGDTNEMFISIGTTGSIYINAGGIGSTYGSGYNDGIEHLLVITFNGIGSGNIYIDGTLLTAHTIPSILWTNVGLTAIGIEYDGGSTPSNYFDGIQQNVIISKDIKTSNLISTNYESTQDNLTSYILADTYIDIGEPLGELLGYNGSYNEWTKSQAINFILSNPKIMLSIRSRYKI